MSKNNTILLSIYTINDFHGAIDEEDNKVGIARLGHFLIQEKKKDEPVFVVSAGDMIQGTAICEKTKGRVMVDLMNQIGFDVMTLGNHEFDWGIAELIKFHHDANEEVKAAFPWINANIYEKSPNRKFPYFDSIHIQERFGIKIGWIGTIGEQQINDIMASITGNLTFTSQIRAIQTWATYLREEQHCDIVVVLTHSDTTFMQERLARLEGSEKIDAVVNAHTHQYYSGEIERHEDAPMVYVQAGYGGKYIGKILLEVDCNTKTIVDAAADHIVSSEVCQIQEIRLLEIARTYKERYPELLTTYAICKQSISKELFIEWFTKELAHVYSVDLAVMNQGGIRGQAFPLMPNQKLHYEKVFEIFPFDNRIVVVSLTKEQVMELKYDTFRGLKVSTEIEELPDKEIYRVLTNDYLFTRANTIYKNGIDVLFTDNPIREEIITYIQQNTDAIGYFAIPSAIKEKGMRTCFTINPMRTESDFTHYHDYIDKGYYQGIEIFYPYQSSEEKKQIYLTNIQKLVNAHPTLEVVMHLPHGPDNSLTDLFHLPVVMKRMVDAIEFASKCKVHKLTLHLGYVEKEEERESIKLQTIEVLKELAIIAKKHQMVLMIENMPSSRELGYSPEEILEIIEASSANNIFFILDTGHAHLSEYSIARYLDVLKSYLIHVHISDNNKTRDDHARMGMGSIDFDLFFDWITKNNYQQLLCMEIIHQNVEDLVVFIEDLKRYTTN